MNVRDVLALVILGAAGLALVLGGIALVGRARAARRSAIAVGVVFLAVVVLLMVQRWHRGADVDLWANGLTGQSHAFQAEVAHSRVYVSGLLYAFKADQSRGDLFAQLSATYPSGRVVGDTWCVVVDGLGYSVVPDASVGSNGYLLSADVVGVTTPAHVVYVPVPHDVAVQLRSGIQPTTTMATRQYPVSLYAAAFCAYYASLGTIHEVDGSFRVPDSAGGIAAVTVSDEGMSVSFDTFPTG